MGMDSGSLVSWLTLLLLAINAVFFWIYLQETKKIRIASEAQFEAQIRPALTVVVNGIGSLGTLCVSNVGSGAALNLRLVRTKEGFDWEAESNFGNRVRGAGVAVGQDLDTGEKVGFVGPLIGERLHLIYESLSGKLYASIVTFEGNGQPARVDFFPKG